MASNFPRGAIPSPRHKLAAAMPYAPVGVTPQTFLVRPAQISFWGNRTDGDCVTAEEAFAKACHHPEIFITDTTAIGWATDNNYLNGAVISDALEKMVASGFQQDGHTYDDGPAQAVNWTNDAVLRNAIANGPVKIGVAANQLDTVYTDSQDGWFATGFAADANEDHCISLCGFGSLSWLAQALGVVVPNGINGSAPGYAVFTWNSVGIIDVPSMVAITHEAWVRTPTTVIN